MLSFEKERCQNRDVSQKKKCVQFVDKKTYHTFKRIKTIVLNLTRTRQQHDNLQCKMYQISINFMILLQNLQVHRQLIFHVIS
jgi:hypothetical protein